MSQYSRNFAADTLGNPPSDFSFVQFGTGTTNVESVASASIGGGKALVLTPQSGNRHCVAFWDTITSDADRENAEVLIKFMTPSSWSGFYEGAAALARLEDVGVLADSYGAGISNGGHTHYAFIGESTNVYGNLPEISGAWVDPGFVPAANTWYWVRFRINGTTLSMWVWEDGDPEKTNADTPDITTTDATFTDGTVGIFWDTAAGEDLCIDFISVGTNGDAAPSAGSNIDVNLDAGAIDVAGQAMDATIHVYGPPGAIDVTGQDVGVSIEGLDVDVTIDAGSITVAGQNMIISRGVLISAGAIFVQGMPMTITGISGGGGGGPGVQGGGVQGTGVQGGGVQGGGVQG